MDFFVLGKEKAVFKASLLSHHRQDFAAASSLNKQA